MPRQHRGDGTSGKAAHIVLSAARAGRTARADGGAGFQQLARRLEVLRRVEGTRVCLGACARPPAPSPFRACGAPRTASYRRRPRPTGFVARKRAHAGSRVERAGGPRRTSVLVSSSRSCSPGAHDPSSTCTNARAFCARTLRTQPLTTARGGGGGAVAAGGGCFASEASRVEMRVLRMPGNASAGVCPGQWPCWHQHCVRVQPAGTLRVPAGRVPVRAAHLLAVRASRILKVLVRA